MNTSLSHPPIVSLQNNEVCYNDKVALSAITLAVQPGEKIALVGPSGAGKTTLLNCIRQNHPEEATLIPQHEGLVETLSVFHNVYMGRLAHFPSWYNLLNLARPFKKRVTEVQELLHLLSLDEKCYEPVASLSGGQRQRTAVARSLYQGGQLLLADEPVSAVDEHRAADIMQLLSQRFSTMIVALHDTQLALNYCDRIIGLKEGEIKFDGPSKTLSASQLATLYGN